MADEAMDTEEQASARLAAFANEVRELAIKRGVAVIAAMGRLSTGPGPRTCPGISSSVMANTLAFGHPDQQTLRDWLAASGDQLGDLFEVMWGRANLDPAKYYGSSVPRGDLS